MAFFGDTYVSSTHLPRPLLYNVKLSPPWYLGFQGVFLSKTTSNLTGKHVLDATACNIDGFFLRDTCVSSPQLNRSILSKHRLSPAWSTKIRKVCLSKLTQFSQENNAVNVAVASTPGFLWSESCGSSPQLSRRIWIKERVCTPWNAEGGGCPPSKTSTLLTGKQCASYSCV
jgi:hypothetical protein